MRAAPRGLQMDRLGAVQAHMVVEGAAGAVKGPISWRAEPGIAPAAFGGTVAGAGDAGGADPEALQQLMVALTARVAGGQLPMLGLVVARRGRVVFSGAAGKAANYSTVCDTMHDLMRRGEGGGGGGRVASTMHWMQINLCTPMPGLVAD